ncbi:hypothetical protein [Cohnella sp. AR92]|uniref:hypothetical protein n=1 Tax=Cohnella sp. AR92 TaxID=648716 RepID=UPI000F8F4E46|nr:hypothetical protein [Cohnella sp. AR92]RUS44568.1 hypothetical protein ELR57_22560 [Cohnella sp. AR92]
MYSIWYDCPSEDEWYEKMVRLLQKHKSYHHITLWDVVLSYIYAVFCQITSDESAPPMYDLFEECGLDVDECVESEGIGVSLDMINTYMTENDLTEITSTDFKDILEYFEDELREKLYARVHEQKLEFWSIINKEFKSTYEKALFFYVREEHYKRALDTYNPAADLNVFVEETDYFDQEFVSTEDDENDEEECDDDESESNQSHENDKEEYIVEDVKPKVKTILYSFVNNNDATEMSTVMRVYDWIEKYS